jgi:hypothetical protein
MKAENLTDDGVLRHSKTSVRRTLEDMECFRMVDRIESGQDHYWRLSPAYAKGWKEMWPPK